jgi:hypothetical protein
MEVSNVQELRNLTLTARRFNLVAVCGTRWHEFLHNPGKRLGAFGPDKKSRQMAESFVVQAKLSRWKNPG